MNNLNIYVCENFAPEYKRIIETEKYDDVILRTFPCTCVSSVKRKNLKEIFSGDDSPDSDRLIICGRLCNVLKLSSVQGAAYKINTSNYCYKNMANESLIQYVLDKGGYVISLGWLNNWEENISNNGFDRETAKKFYGEFCTELVFMDSGIEPEAVMKLDKLAEYLGLPYTVIPFELENIKVYLRSIVYEWRLDKKGIDYKNTITELRKESAEYSAIFNIIERIATSANQREIINKLLEVFTVVFGAQTCRYVDASEDTYFTKEVEDEFLSSEKDYSMSADQHEIMIKISRQSDIYGVLIVGDFMFPQYIEKYINFAISISRIGALAISNAKKYEALAKSKEDITFISYHDTLTGLYNRAYFNKALEEHATSFSVAIFVCDIDGLKYVNDTFGHIEGDNLICMAANALKKCFRETDIVARIGGDEYAVIVPECNQLLAENFKSRINQMIEIQNENNTNKDYT
ncbi:MAG: GGDEF domain-containing protein, partial [Oscillospiraceae bacterium]